MRWGTRDFMAPARLRRASARRFLVVVLRARECEQFRLEHGEPGRPHRQDYRAGLELPGLDRFGFARVSL